MADTKASDETVNPDALPEPERTITDPEQPETPVPTGIFDQDGVQQPEIWVAECPNCKRITKIAMFHPAQPSDETKCQYCGATIDEWLEEEYAYK